MIRSFAMMLFMWSLPAALPQSSAAQSQPPQEKSVQFLIHKYPANPNTPVEKTISLDLRRRQVHGDTIGWEVMTVTISKLHSSGTTTWIDTAPSVGTIDGLWWTQHENVSEPQLSEFRSLPAVEGTGENLISSGPECEYAFSGALPETEEPYAVTTMLDHWLLVGDETEPEEGDDEPVDTDDDDVDPV